MLDVVYFFIYIIIFLIIYILVNYITIFIFNKDKPDFILKPVSHYRLDNNYSFGVDNIAGGDLNCTTDDNKLIECDIDDSNELGRDAVCAQCKQISARCVNIREPIYSSTDPNLIIIEPNASANKGYCLPSVPITSSCTRRNGGKWILTKSSSENAKEIIYTFECFCSTSNFFQNNPLDGNDCTQFIGCRHGKLIDNWSDYESMQCLCPQNLYMEKSGTSTHPPTCVLLNVYRRKYDELMKAPFEILDPQYIDKSYLVLLGNEAQNISLPNPCTFDITTKTFIKDIGRVVFDKNNKIAYCESIHSNYKSITINDDYLMGNGGQYANAMFRFRIRNSTEENDDADDNYNQYDNGSGIMYEVCRKNAKSETLAGVRIPYNNFPIYLPYLEPDSFNMGNSLGRLYKVHPVIPKFRQAYAMIYIFDTYTPDYDIKIVFGNSIQYVPSFMTTSMDSRYRVYNGAIPCVNVRYITDWYDKRAFNIMYPTPPGTNFKNKLGQVGIAGDLVSPNITGSNFIGGYAFDITYKNKIEPNSLLFTGTIFTYAINKKIFTRPVSCGDEVLTNKYRFHFDPNWRSYPQVPLVGVSTSNPFQFALTGRDSHMFTRNSYNIEQNEIGLPTKKIARYEFKNNKVQFQIFYS